MLLVIARKFNDIYYSMSIPEWMEETERHLFIISNGIPKESFPNQEAFDKVDYIRYEGESIKNILAILKKINSFNIPKADVVILSNPILVTNQYLIKKIKPSKLIFIEDGSMNYSSFVPSKSIAKKLLQLSLGINQAKIFNAINFTYLFYPEKSTFFFGKTKKLNLCKDIFPRKENDEVVNNKRILVGQPLYHGGFMSLERYNEIMNKAIAKFNIDFYIPHAFASDQERIQCPIINLAELNTTLEGLASNHTFHIFSLGSTVLYSCKTVNPKVKSSLLTVSDEGMRALDTSFVKSFCDEILKID